MTHYKFNITAKHYKNGSATEQDLEEVAFNGIVQFEVNAPGPVKKAILSISEHGKDTELCTLSGGYVYVDTKSTTDGHKPFFTSLSDKKSDDGIQKVQLDLLVSRPDFGECTQQRWGIAGMALIKGVKESEGRHATPYWITGERDFQEIES